MSLGQIRHILTHSHDRTERDRAVEELLPQLWDRWPHVRYRACCTLTTRIYLPFGLHPMEWMSFPRAFSAALRHQQRSSGQTPDSNDVPRRKLFSFQMPDTHEARRTLAAETLILMLRAWNDCQRHGAGKKAAYFITVPNDDMGADICEALGRLGISAAEEALLEVVSLYRAAHFEVRTAALLALAEMPPQELTTLWRALKQAALPERRILAAAIEYIDNPEAVPILLEILNAQTETFHNDVSQPLLKKLGLIRDVRALPVLTYFAREGPESLRPTAQTAIRRLMKGAQGMEEVTLVRASALSTLNQDMLLRSSDEGPGSRRPEELLRPSAGEKDEG